MQRIAQLIQVNEADIPEYERIHAEVWPGVLAQIAKSNIRNYSIYRHGNLLFAYMEYHGTDYAADMAAMAEDPTTREWWNITAPMQSPVPEAVDGESWHTLREVFHTD